MRNSRFPITTSGWVKSMTASVFPSVSRLSGSPASTSADRVRSSAAWTAATIVSPTLPLAPSTPTRMPVSLDGAGYRLVIRAVGLFGEGDHRLQVSVSHALAVQGAVDLPGERVRR